MLNNMIERNEKYKRKYEKSCNTDSGLYGVHIITIIKTENRNQEKLLIQSSF